MELLGSGVDGRNRSAGSFGQVSGLSSIELRFAAVTSPARQVGQGYRYCQDCEAQKPWHRHGSPPQTRDGLRPAAQEHGGALQFRCSAEARGPCARGSIHLREVADHSAHTMSVCRGCQSNPAPLTGPQMCLVKPIDANSRIRAKQPIIISTNARD